MEQALRRVSSEVCDELRYPHVDVKGLAGDRLFITPLFSSAPPLHRGQMGGPIQKQRRLIDRRLARPSAAVTISCLTRERGLLISFLAAGWPLSGSQVIRDGITDLPLQTWTL